MCVCVEIDVPRGNSAIHSGEHMVGWSHIYADIGILVINMDHSDKRECVITTAHWGTSWKMIHFYASSGIQLELNDLFFHLSIYTTFLNYI